MHIYIHIYIYIYTYIYIYIYTYIYIYIYIYIQPLTLVGTTTPSLRCLARVSPGDVYRSKYVSVN